MFQPTLTLKGRERRSKFVLPKVLEEYSFRVRNENDIEYS